MPAQQAHPGADESTVESTSESTGDPSDDSIDETKDGSVNGDGKLVADPVDSIVGDIGPKVAGLRKAQKLSLQQLASRSDVSAAAIHKIERSGMVPTITTLLKLASALGVSVGYFVQEQELHPEPVHYTPSDGRRPVFTPHHDLSLASISGSYRQFDAAAAMATMRVGAHSGDKPLRHSGEELVFVIRGGAQFTIGESTYDLTPGDSLHWTGDLAHSWANVGDQDAELLWVVFRGA